MFYTKLALGISLRCRSFRSDVMISICLAIAAVIAFDGSVAVSFLVAACVFFLCGLIELIIISAICG